MREEFERTNKKRPGRPLVHRVLLTKTERETLVQIAEDPPSDYHGWRARVLLDLDEGKFAQNERQAYEQLAEANGVSKATIFNTARRFAVEGLEATLNAAVSGPRITSEEEKELADLVNWYNRESINWSFRSLARELGRSPMAVSRALDRLEERAEIIPPENS